MKNFLLSLAIFFTISSFVSFSFSEVVLAFKSVDAAQVSKFFDNTIEITMPGKSNSFSKGQAEQVLRDFFASNQVKDFEVLHSSENAGSQFCIGNLKTNNGTFRTTIFMKQKGDKDLLQELRFEN